MDYMTKAQVEILKAHNKGEKVWTDADDTEVALGDRFSFVVIPAACCLLDLSKLNPSPGLYTNYKRLAAQAVEARLTDSRRERKDPGQPKRILARFEVEGEGDVWVNTKYLTLAPVSRWVYWKGCLLGLGVTGGIMCGAMRRKAEARV